MNNIEDKYRTEIKSPFGTIHVLSTGKFITNILLPGASTGILLDYCLLKEIPRNSPHKEAISIISEWLKGKDIRITKVFHPVGTKFQMEVWSALSKVPRGTVVSYGELAMMVGKPGASQAVGRAMALNQLPLVIPCHRVIASGGRLGGYGGGEALKRQLLEFEGVRVK